MMTRSLVKEEPDQENQTDLPMQRCSIPGETSKIVKNMDTSNTSINGILTTRYGRPIRLIHSLDDNLIFKSSKMPKESQATESQPVDTTNHESLKNGGTDETEKKPDKKLIEKKVDGERKSLKKLEIRRKSEIKTEKNDEDIEMETSYNNTSVKSESMDTKEGVIEANQSGMDCDESITSSTYWMVGQLAWAQVSNYPYWPCIITTDPREGIFVKEKPHGKRTRRLIHVQYFGDNGRHNWVNEGALMDFLGLASFDKMAEEVRKGKKKQSKLYSGFYVKTTIKKKWDTAVSEAEALFPLSMAERFKVVGPKRKRGRPRLSQSISLEPVAKRQKLDESLRAPKLEESLSSQKLDESLKPEKLDESSKPQKPEESSKPQKPEESSKPQKSEESSKPQKIEESSKRGSIDEDLAAIKLRKNFDDDVKDMNLATETPPTPPSSHKDSSDESTVIKSHRGRRKKDWSSDFETYYQINKENRDIIPPHSTPEESREYLKKVWEGMSAYRRNKYKNYIPAHMLVKEKSTDPEEEPDERTPKTRKSRSKKEKEPLDTTIESRKSTSSKSMGVVKAIKEKEPLDTTIDSRKSTSKSMGLFKGLKSERVCQICEKTGNLTRCKGPCYSYFHLSCVKPGESESECEMDEDTVESSSTESAEDGKKSVKREEEEENFKCIDCLSGVAPACFICNEREEDRERCAMVACGKHYHIKCLKTWPQSHCQGGRLTCPYHMCHTCISDNPQHHHGTSTNDKLARCVRCPSAYHPSPKCIPAGTQILTGTQVICPKHYVAPHPPLNAAWCFLCTRGGSLICCDTCPTSFHPECLGIDAPDDAFICEDCETGRLPLYGEVVWVKLGHYRWWPSVICFPHEIPTNLTAVPHSPGEFCVMFLGTNNYYWVHRGRCFLYQEGDSCAKITIGKKNVDEAYKRAVDEANELHQQVKNARVASRVADESRKLKPPPYVKVKVNKPVGNVKPTEFDSMVACECDSNWKNPCSPDSDCLNRILSIECHPTICPAGSKCNNQSFVRRTYPAMEPFHTVGRGWGLKSLEPIKMGQFVIEYVGEVIDEAEYKRRLERKKELRNENYYFLTIDNSRTIDAEPKGNLSRFMNHSCQPNCETQKWTVNGDTRIGLFALTDIEPGEELTFNYNLATEGETKKPCLCGAPNCSGYIGLKAQKPQLSVIQQTKIEKAEKVKRSRKNKKTYNCWKCAGVVTPEDEIECGMKSCFKKYHRECLKEIPGEGRFSCPWHHCIDCERRTSARCLLCCTAYCQSHLDGKLIEQKDRNGYLCKTHENALGEVDNNSDNNSDGVVVIDDDDVKSMKDEKDDSDDEFDTASLLADSDSPMADEEVFRPRVSIVEVDLSSEESNDSPPPPPPPPPKEDKVPKEEELPVKDEDLPVKEEELDLDDIPLKRRKKLLSIASSTNRQLHQIIGGDISS